MSRKIVWVLAFVMAAVSALLVYRSMEDKPGREKAAVIPTVKVMVATTAIPARTVIKPEWVELKDVPVNAVPPDAARSPREVLGKITRSEILPGETVRRERLLAEGEKLGLPFMIPAGYRGMTIAVDEVIGVAGFVKPGDLVDVLVTFNSDIFNQRTTVTLLQGVKVLAVAQDFEAPGGDQAKKGKVVTSVTLAVNPLQAEQLALAGESGKLRLALCPLNNEEQVDVPPVNPYELVKGKLPTGPQRGGRNSGAVDQEAKPAARRPAASPAPAPAPVPAPAPQKKVEVILGDKTVQVNVD